MPYVYSTITNDTSYCHYEKGGADLPRLARKITIKGGTGIANKYLLTPLGVVTFVTDEQLSFLKDNKAFQRHNERGFITWRDDNVDPEKVAVDMTVGDGSSPIVPQDFKDSDPAKPTEDKPQSIKEKIANRKG